MCIVTNQQRWSACSLIPGSWHFFRCRPWSEKICLVVMIVSCFRTLWNAWLVTLKIPQSTSVKCLDTFPDGVDEHCAVRCSCFHFAHVLLPPRRGVLSPAWLRFCCHSGEIQQRSNVFCVRLRLLHRLQEDVPRRRQLSERKDPRCKCRKGNRARESKAASVTRCTQVF